MLAHVGIYGNEMGDVEAKKGKTNKNKILVVLIKEILNAKH